MRVCVCLCAQQNSIYKIQYNQRRRSRLISTAAINKISTGKQAGTRESKVTKECALSSVSEMQNVTTKNRQHESKEALNMKQSG